MANKDDAKRANPNRDYFSSNTGRTFKLIDDEYGYRVAKLQDLQKIKEALLKKQHDLEMKLATASESQKKELEEQLQHILSQSAEDIYKKRKQQYYEFASIEEKIGMISREAAEAKRAIQEEINELINKGVTDEKEIAALKAKQQSIVAGSIRDQQKLNEASLKAVEAYGTKQEQIEAKRRLWETQRAKLKEEKEKAYQSLVSNFQGKLTKEKEEEFKRQVEQQEDIIALQESVNSSKKAIRSTKVGIQSDKEYGKELLDSITKSLEKTFSNLKSDLERDMFLYSDKSGVISTRLMGSNYNWGKVSENVSSMLAGSSVVKQEKMVESLTKLVEEGVAQDLQQRAFLLSIQENVATTFDAANGTLLRIIRLQQSNSTAQRMAMEANLNEFLNSYFEDTSYLTDTLDNVTNALVEATSLFSAEGSANFEYVVQKWLGALTAKGLSSSAATNIAQGIGYLFSGDVQSLSSNDSVQSLLAMSASRAGLSYSDLLVSGGTASSVADTNKLLQSMVSYLREIAKSNNNVVRSEYAHLYGLTASDLSAISNMSDADIANVFGSSYNYTSATADIQKLLNTTRNRIAPNQQYKTLVDNFKTSIATGVGNSKGQYTIYEAANVLNAVAGGVPLPTVYVMGNAIDLPTISDLLQGGVFGLNLVSALGDVFSSEGGLQLFDNGSGAKSWESLDRSAGGSSSFFDFMDESIGELSEAEITRKEREKAKKEQEKASGGITSVNDSSSSSSGSGYVYIDSISSEAAKSIGSAVSEALLPTNSTSVSDALNVNIIGIADGILPKTFGAFGGLSSSSNPESLGSVDATIVGLSGELIEYLNNWKSNTAESTIENSNTELLSNLTEFLSMLTDSNDELRDSINELLLSNETEKGNSVVIEDISSITRGTLEDLIPKSIKISEVSDNILSAIQPSKAGDTNVTIDGTVTAAISDALVKAITDSLSENNIGKNITLLQAIYDMRDSLKNIALSNYQETADGNISISDILNSISESLKKDVGVRVNNIDFDDAIDKLTQYLDKNMF